MGSGRLADYLGKGVAADRPVTLDLHPEAVGFYYATDTEAWSAWDGTGWVPVMAGGGGGGSPQDLQSVLDTGNEAEDSSVLFRGESVGSPTWMSFSHTGMAGGVELAPGAEAFFDFTGGAWMGDLTQVGLGSFRISAPAAPPSTHVVITFPAASGTLVLNTQLAATAGAAGIGYDNAASGLSAVDVQAAIDELAQDSGGAESLGDLSDVDVSAPALGDALVFDGADWVSGRAAATPLLLTVPDEVPTLGQLVDGEMAVNVTDKVFYFRIGGTIHSVEVSPPLPPSNSVAPQISGNTWSGQVLTCTTGTWTGSMPFTYAYQWLADGTPISGATSSTYTIAVGEGVDVSCEVTASNVAGADSVETSAITVTVAPPTQVTAPTMSGTPEAGQTLTSTNGGWSGADSYVYQWMNNGTPISGATSNTYVVGVPVDSVVYCRVGAVNTGGTTYGASNSFHIRDGNSLPVFGSQNSGVGGTWGTTATRAFASPATISEDITTQVFYAHFGFGDGTGGVTPGTPWRAMVYDDDGGVPGELLADAAGTLTAGGRWQGIPLEVSLAPGTYWLAVSAGSGTVNAATAAQGGLTNGMQFVNNSFDMNDPPSPWPTAGSEARNNTLAAFMTYVEGEPAEEAPENVSAPVVSGNTDTGSLLTCSPGTWTGTAPITYAYQWRANGVNISGATASTYTTTQTAGTVITCQVTASNSVGSDSEVSNGITLTEAIPDTAPENTVAPVITGSPVIGSQLSCSTGTWTGTAPITYAYQWRADGTPIGGATAATYTTVQAEDTVITCTVTATNAVGSDSEVSNGITLEEAPPVGMPTFDGLSTPNMSVSPRLAEYGTASNVASCFTSTPLTGKHYIEMEAIRVAGLAGVALYNEERVTLPTNAPPGQWYEAAAFHSSLAGWSTGTYANTNLPREFSNNTSHGSAGSAQRHAICVDATDPAEVKIWVRTPTLPPPGTATWIGGGDPATGTDPTLIMEGEGPAMIGATLSAAGNSVEWIEPGDQQWTAPTGFVPT